MPFIANMGFNAPLAFLETFSNGVYYILQKEARNDGMIKNSYGCRLRVIKFKGQGKRFKDKGYLKMKRCDFKTRY